MYIFPTHSWKYVYAFRNLSSLFHNFHFFEWTRPFILTSVIKYAFHEWLWRGRNCKKTDRQTGTEATRKVQASFPAPIGMSPCVDINYLSTAKKNKKSPSALPSPVLTPTSVLHAGLISNNLVMSHTRVSFCSWCSIKESFQCLQRNWFSCLLCKQLFPIGPT